MPNGSRVKRDIRSIVSRTLIALGAVTVVAAAVYEAAEYPWALVFGGRREDLTYEDIPDPPPIDFEQDLPDPDYSDPEPMPSGTGTPDASAETEPSPAALPGEAPILSPKPTKSGGGNPAPRYTQLGVLKIPALKLSVNILEGSGDQMKYGVAHVTGTDGAGTLGNCALAGHRSYMFMHPFRHLDKLVPGDKVIVKWGERIFTYVMYEGLEVLPEDVYVLGEIEGEPSALTLITCTPLVSFTHRLIVRCRLTEADGVPAEEYIASLLAEKASHPTESAAEPPSMETPDDSAAPSDADAAPLPTDSRDALSEDGTEASETVPPPSDGEAEAPPGAEANAALP